MATKAARLLFVLGVVAAIAGTDAIAQQTASQLVTVRHASGQGVAPFYEGFDINVFDRNTPLTDIVDKALLK